MMRLQPDLINAIDEARSREVPPVSRQEILRRALVVWLRRRGLMK
jgi:hypothetical protein